MRLKIEKHEKVEMLKALKEGFLETDNIPTLKEALDKAQPARILTKEEAREFLTKIENEC